MYQKIIKPPAQNSCIVHKHQICASCSNSDCLSCPHKNSAKVEKKLLIGKYGNVYRTLLQFDFSSLPFFTNLSSGSLCLFLWRKDNCSEKAVVDIHQILSSWREDTVSWDNQPMIAKIPEATITVPDNYLGCISVNISSLLQKWCSGEAANFGLLLKAQNETQPNLVGLHSKEYANSLKWPCIQINFLPATCPPPIIPLTINKRIPLTATPALQSAAVQEILLFNYSYLITNIGPYPAQAFLEVSADNLHWEQQSAIHIIEPNQQVTLVADVIAQFARLSYQSLEPTATTQLIVYIQGRS